MEKIFTSKEFLQKRSAARELIPSALRSFSFLAVLATLICCLPAATVSAQGTYTGAPGEVIGISDLVRPDWLQTAAFTAVVAAERANTALLLSAPDLKESQIALYKGYDKMLVYMQNDLILQHPVDNLAVTNRDKVILEAPNDPELVKMQAIEFQVMYYELVDKLIRH